MSDSQDNDNFDSAQNEDLQFDHNAFKVFFSFLCLILLIFTLKKFLKNLKFFFEISSKKPKKNLQKKMQEKKLKKSLKISTLFLAISLTLFTYSVKKSIFTQGLKSFDPYEILEIKNNSTDKEINKAYKNLAKIHHPDKNRNDPNAHKNFIILTKAYQCIKNEKSRKSCFFN